jgi:hypothetical protein
MCLRILNTLSERTNVLSFSRYLFVISTLLLATTNETLRDFPSKCCDCWCNKVTGYALCDRTLIRGEGKEFPFTSPSRPAFEPTQTFIQWAQVALSPKVRRQKDRSNHSSRCTTEVTKMYSCISTPQHAFTCGTAIPSLINFSSEVFLVLLYCQTDKFRN